MNIELNRGLINRLPYDVIINNILPYSYCPKPKNLLLDIQSFVSDYSILVNAYVYDYNFDILIYDLICFYNRSCLPTYMINDWFRYLLRRQFRLKNNTNTQLNKFIFNVFYRDVVSNIGRKTRFLWGVLSPIERTQFINKYILEDI